MVLSDMKTLLETGRAAGIPGPDLAAEQARSPAPLPSVRAACYSGPNALGSLAAI
jgi:hypothetical protein